MKRAIRIITNKYLVTGVIFVVWVVYFDQNDWMSMQQRQKELKGVKDNISYLNNEIAHMNSERIGLLTNPAKLEQYARENFKMKHDGEDVYVIDDGKGAH